MFMPNRVVDRGVAWITRARRSSSWRATRQVKDVEARRCTLQSATCSPRESFQSVAMHRAEPAPQPADLMTDDLVHYVADFLAPSDLLSAIQVNSWWGHVCASDVIWRRLCVTRWLLPRPERLRRSTGTTSFLELYLYLDRARYLPRGKYTTKHQIVWGRGRDEGADVWMTVAHSSNCQVQNTAGTPYIQLRVVVQNLLPQPLTVDLQELEVRMKGGDEGTIFGVGLAANQPRGESADAAGRIKQLAPVVLAVNGVDVHPSLTSQLIELKMFDFAVLAVNVVCNGCEFEPDFLESCNALWVPIRRIGRCTSLSTCRCGLIPDSYHRGIIRVPVIDESVIWRHYDLVSNRFMVLDTRSVEDVDHFSNLLGSPISHFSKRKRSISSAREMKETLSKYIC